MSPIVAFALLLLMALAVWLFIKLSKTTKVEEVLKPSQEKPPEKIVEEVREAEDVLASRVKQNQRRQRQIIDETQQIDQFLSKPRRTTRRRKSTDI